MLSANYSNTSQLTIGGLSDNATAVGSYPAIMTLDNAVGNVGIGLASTVVPSSTLQVAGSFGATYNNVSTANYTMTATDYYLAYNGAGGTITLPAAISGTGNYKGRNYLIKNTGSASVIIAANGTELLDNQSGAGVSNFTLPAGYFATLVSTGNTGATTTFEVAFVGSSSTSTPINADNGLTVGYNSAGKVGLGGTLARNTDVAKAGFNLTFSGAGNVGIGTAAPTQVLDIVGLNTNTDNIHLTSYSTTPSPALRLRAAEGTLALPSFVTTSSTSFGSWNNAVWNGSAFTDVTAIRSFATENHSATGLGSNMVFLTTANGTTAAAERMRIDQDGQVGIGTASPNSFVDLGTLITGKKLAIYNNAAGTDFYGFGLSNSILQFHVGNTAAAAADMTLSSIGDLTIAGAAYKPGGGAWTATSDRRAKKNIHAYGMGLQQIMAINPVTFQYNGKYGEQNNGKTYVGIIAQDMEKVLPGTITTQKRDDVADFKTYDPSEVTYTLINAVKEQQAEIEALRTSNAKLTTEVAAANAWAAEVAEMKTAMAEMRAELSKVVLKKVAAKNVAKK